MMVLSVCYPGVSRERAAGCPCDGTVCLLSRGEPGAGGGLSGGHVAVTGAETGAGTLHHAAAAAAGAAGPPVAAVSRQKPVLLRRTHHDGAQDGHLLFHRHADRRHHDALLCVRVSGGGGSERRGVKWSLEPPCLISELSGFC